MGRPKLTQDEIIKQVELLGLKFVKFIKYDGKLSIFTVKCEHDHEEYETTLSILNHGRHAKGCPTCKYLNKIQTNINKVGIENVKTYCENVGFEILSNEKDYTGTMSDIKLKCPNNHIFTTNYRNFKKRVNKCEYCIKEEKLNKAIQRARELNYILIDNEYIGKNNKLNIICDKGHEWHPTYDSFVYAENKCFYCQYSKGETRIEDFLLANSISYVKQHTFESCIYKRKLKFDFYLPEFNVCIEYDGIQHFEAQEHFGGEQKYTELCIKDDIKNEFCFTNDIGMIRISYEDYELIEYILEKELNLNY